MNKIKSNKTPKHLVKRGKKGFGIKSFSLAAITGLTLFGTHANAEGSVITGAAADFVEEYQATGERTYNFESADDVYTLQTDLGVMGEGSFTVNGVAAEDGSKSIIDMVNGYVGMNISQASDLTIKDVAFSNINENRMIYVDNSEANVNLENIEFSDMTISTSGNIEGKLIAVAKSNSVNISGNFENNKIISNKEIHGGIIANISKINNINANFVNNYAESNKTSNIGGIRGLIYNGKNGQIGNIEGRFINNTSVSKTNLIEAQGVIMNWMGEIGDINVDFEGNTTLGHGNKTVYGSAITNYGGTSIGNIRGNFINNSSISNSAGDTSGAITSWSSINKINSITGYFEGNNAQSAGRATAGAINNNTNSIITEGIAADFVGNWAKSTSTNALARAGAVLNLGYTPHITGDFTENHAESSGTGAIGGAVANLHSSSNTLEKEGIDKLEGNFTGNYAYATGDTGYALGGAIYNTGVIGEITNSVFNGNYAKSENGEAKGGALYISGEHASIGDITADFTGNYAETSCNTGDYHTYGGAIYVGEGASVNNINGEFSSNNASYGGAIYIKNAVVNEIGGTFKNNEAPYMGGAIWTNSDITLADNTTFEENVSHYGGAIHSQGDLITIGNDATFIGNRADMGAAIHKLGGSVVIGDNLTLKDNIATTSDQSSAVINQGMGSIAFTSCNEAKIGNNALFENNHAVNWGGAIFATDTNSVTIGDNATFKGNTAKSGGAIYIQDTDSLTIGDDVTFNENHASRGGSIYAERINSLTIGDSASFGENTSTDGAIYTNNVNKIKIGDDAVFRNVNSNRSGSLYANNYDIIEIGDNYTVDTNGADDGLFASANSRAQNRIIRIGDNAEFQHTGDYAIGSFYTNHIIFGNNLKVHDTKRYGAAIWYWYNSDDDIDKSLVIGDNAEFYNINGYALSSMGTYSVDIGDNFSAHDISGNYVLELHCQGLKGKHFTLGDNANFSNNLTNELLYLSAAEDITIGNNFKANNNLYGYFIELYSSKGSTVSFGDNTEITNNKSTSSSHPSLMRIYDADDVIFGDNLKINNNDGCIDIDYVNKVNIGDNFEYTNNNKGYVYASFRREYTDSEFILGNNANLSNNFIAHSQILSAAGINKFIVGDDLKINNNRGGFSIYTYFYDGNDNIYKIGDNFEMIGNISGQDGQNSNVALYIYNAKNVEIGNNATLKDNILLNNIMISANGNSNTQDTNTFKVGDNFTFDNNQTLDNGMLITNFNTIEFGKNATISNNQNVSSNYNFNPKSLIYAANMNKFTIGDNLTYTDNKAPYSNIYASFNSSNTDNEFSIGDNATISNNTNTASNGLIYADNLNKFTIGNLTYTDNQYPYSDIHVDFVDNGIFSIGNNATISNNYNNSLHGLVYAQNVNKFSIGDNLTYTNNNGTSSIYTYFKPTDSYKEFSIGNNATVSNNFNTVAYGLVYATNVNKFTIVI